ncbi:hypothetical protein AB0D27_29230 [Streptomyces sp. NPDC048415]|jgi:hypothetical protein|uniref:hypothetical protein n=1 Tax=Streptomyces sp. NPDC048415 TaxID=3154822 RepID=UPI00343F05C2
MSESPLPGSEVQVVLSDCSAADAGRLFAVLCGHFASDRCAEDQPHHVEEHHRPTVWTGTFDTSASPGGTAAPIEPLSGSVSVEAQGSHLAVKRLRRALGEVFTVHETGEDAGDQEVQVQLRLDSDPAHTPRTV